MISREESTILNGPNADGTVDCGPMPGKGLDAAIEFSRPAIQRFFLNS
jgi:hypothetical protein